MRFALHLVALFAAGAMAMGCVSPGPGPESGQRAAHAIEVCHGFGCRFTTELALGAGDARTFAGYFRGARTPEAERRAISRAVQHFERRTTQVIGRRDNPKSTARENGLSGQMDCIDESRNTRALLLHLRDKGLLRHHAVEANVTRGMLLDSRYFHSTAVVRDRAGRSWAVDSWYEAAGGPPDIMPLEEWKERGVQGVR